MTNFIPGNVVVLTFGPFRCTATVMEVTDVGIVVAPNDDAKLVGYQRTQYAPNGRALTNDVMHTFIGSAHLHELEVVTP